MLLHGSFRSPLGAFFAFILFRYSYGGAIFGFPGGLSHGGFGKTVVYCDLPVSEHGLGDWDGGDQNDGKC